LLRSDPTEKLLQVGKPKRRNMKISKIIPALVVTCALGVTASPAIAKQEGKAKGKGSEKRSSKENSGRHAGEMPSGLQKYSEKKGQLPSGLQKMKDKDGQLTKGLQNGGKKLK
jgi:hypothetical protein